MNGLKVWGRMDDFNPKIFRHRQLLRKSLVNYDELPDLELVSLLRTSDHSAFNEIVRRYSGLLINFGYKRLGDLPLAEDLVGDVWADLWEKRATVNISCALGAFLVTSIRNRFLDYIKRQKISQKYIDNFYNFLSKEHSSTDYLIRHNDLLKLIELEIAALPENMRKVFEMNRKTNMTRKEIAWNLNIPENTVKTNMHRALIILKNRLAHLYSFVL